MVRLSLDTTSSPRAEDGDASTPAAPTLPTWPLTALFGCYAVWWAVGLLDMVIIPIAALMVLLMVRTPGMRTPRGFGLWMLFLLWALFSIIEVRFGTALVGFAYRFSIYASGTVVFLYIYNARPRLTGQRVLGLLTIVWLTTVVGGYLGVVLPHAVVRTPMSFVVLGLKSALPALNTLLSNDLVTYMVVRRFAQYNPGSYFDLSPRPAAPFRFTNNWGNAYSVLLPLVVAYALQTTPRRRRLLFVVVLPLSLVPAFLTLNRGMAIGIVVAALYVGFRLTLMGRPKILAYLALAGVVAITLYAVLPVQQRIDSRLANEGSSNDTRSSLYAQSLASVPESPIFGFGVPKEGDNPNAPPVGTQGQVWMILVSHGPVALAASMGWLLLAIVQSRRRRDLTGFAAHTALIVATLELLYYGVLPYGIPLMLAAAALALRPADDGAPRIGDRPGRAVRAAAQRS